MEKISPAPPDFPVAVSLALSVRPPAQTTSTLCSDLRS
jgi:hypothetical protein